MLNLNEEARSLTQTEMRQIEGWARNTRLAEMLSFLENLPRYLFLPRPVLLCSNGEWEILAEGFVSRRQIIGAVAHLDEPFNSTLVLQKTLMAEKREKSRGVMETVYQELSKGFEKVCLAQALGGCRGKIVHAHTLQKAAFQAHARNGHVYEIDPFNVEPGGHWPTLVGIHRATTLTGFCEEHDAALFRPIETERFNNHPQQFFLHHYRAVAQAFYNRAYKGKVLERIFVENSKKPGIGSLAKFEESIRINTIETEELRHHKRYYEEQLKAANWSAVDGHAWIGTKVPDFFAADFFGPRKNFQGRIIQDTKSLLPLHWVSLTVTADERDRALVLLCAEKGSEVLESLASSLKRIPRDHRTMAIVNYIVCHLENFIMLPAWWEPLGERTKRLFVNAYDSRYFPRELPHVCEWRLSEHRDSGLNA